MSQPYSPFWTNRSLDFSNQSWLPLDNLYKMISNSWFTIFAYTSIQENPIRVYDFPSPVVDLRPFKTQRVQGFPTSEQSSILKGFFGASRYTYNQCLNLFKNNVARTKKELRTQCVNKDSFSDPSMNWLLETPYSIRDEAMNDLYIAYMTGLKMVKRCELRTFNLKYRSKNDRSQSIVICRSNITSISGSLIKFFPRFIKEPLKCAEELPEINHDCRLQWNPQLNEYYLCIPIDLSPRDTQVSSPYQRIIALDPGVRTFITGYDPRGFVFKWGHRDLNRIYRLCYHLDHLQSKLTRKDILHKNRYQLKRAIGKLRKKIKKENPKSS